MVCCLSWASQARARSIGGEQMAEARATRIALTATEQQALTRVVAAHSTAQQVVLRARIILLLAEGRTNVAVGQVVGVSREAVRVGRDRWLAL